MNDRFRVVQREVLEFALLCNDWQNHPAPCLQFLAIFDDTFFKFKCLNVQSAVLRVESKASRARLFISLCLAVPQSVVRASNGANPICIQSLAVLLLLHPYYHTKQGVEKNSKVKLA